MGGSKAAQLSCAAPKRERKRWFAGGTYHLISSYKPCNFLESWGRPAGGGLSAAYKRTKSEFRRGEVLFIHFRLKLHPPGADLNFTLSAQRNTGSASNKNYRRPEKVASAAEASGGRLQPSSRSKRDFFRRSRRKGAGGWSPYRGPEHSGLCVCEGGSGIPVLARRQYLYFLPWVGARECRPRVSGGN